MKALIIEDEVMAAQTLQKLLEEVSPGVEITNVLDSIEESVEWLQQNAMPDLIFMDIHLADGSAFAIFEQVEVSCPVIFTTAYDEYALKAFEVNSIDYLLKPVSRDALEHALNKYHNLAERRINADQIAKFLSQLGEKKNYRKFYLMPERDKLIPLAVQNIAYVYIDAKTVKIITKEGKTYYVSSTLDDLMDDLDPYLFFRANRQFIVARDMIKDVSVWFGNKLAINLTVDVPERIIVSKARVAEFKIWFTR